MALIVSVVLRFNFSVDQAQRVLNLPSFIGVLALYTLGYVAVGSHKGILRHTSLDDVKKVLKSTGWGYGDVVGMVRKIKAIVPEYISKNSEFESLDG